MKKKKKTTKNNVLFFLNIDPKGSMCSENSNGPKMEPWGTTQEDKNPSSCTGKLLPVKTQESVLFQFVLGLTSVNTVRWKLLKYSNICVGVKINYLVQVPK